MKVLNLRRRQPGPFLRSIAVAASIAAIGVLVACGGGQVPEKDLADKPADSGPPDYYMSDEMVGALVFEQNVERSYNFEGVFHVPEPGNPVVTLEGLPEGATFQNFQLTWRPPCGNLDKYSIEGDWWFFQIRVTLKSDLDERQYIQRILPVLVHRYETYEDRPCIVSSESSGNSSE